MDLSHISISLQNELFYEFDQAAIISWFFQYCFTCNLALVKYVKQNDNSCISFYQKNIVYSVGIIVKYKKLVENKLNIKIEIIKTLILNF